MDDRSLNRMVGSYRVLYGVVKRNPKKNILQSGCIRVHEVKGGVSSRNALSEALWDHT